MTSVRTVSPLDGTGALKTGFHVTRRVGHGTCQRGSYLTGVADRCTTPAVSGVVLDPCWPTTSAKTYVCQAKPWQHKVIQVHTRDEASGGPGAFHEGLPWAIRLGRHVRCLLDPGSVRRLNGHALLYHCNRHQDVFGPLRKSGTHWKAHSLRTHARTRTGYKSLGWRPITIAWYGAKAVKPSPSPTPTPPVLLPTDTPTSTPTASP